MHYKKLITALAAAVAAVLLLCSPCLAEDASAGADGTSGELRVAFYPLEGFFEYDETGVESGYGVELLNKISSYTGIKFSYVRADSWESTKYMLLDGEADVRMPATMPLTPSKTLGYTSASILDTYHVILALDSRDDLYYNDYDTIKTLKIAISTSFYTVTSVKNYLDRIGITEDQLIFCEEYNDCRELLMNGGADALVSNIMDMESGMKMLARFNNVSNYITMTIKNAELYVLDEAIAQIKLDEPLFLPNLYEKWFPERTVVPMTLEESEYIESVNTLTFAFRSDEGYLQRYEDGEFYGIYVEQAKAVCDKLGVRFRAVSMEECLAGNEKTDVYAGFYYDKNFAAEWNFGITSPISDINYYVIQKKNTVVDESACKVAAVSKFRYTEEYLQKKYSPEQLIYYDDYEKCLLAIENGEADVAVINNYIAEYYLEKYQFSDLAARLMTEYSHLYCLAAADGNDVLASVLSKAISSITDDDMKLIYIRGMEEKPRNDLLLAMIYGHPMQFALAVAIFSMVLILLVMMMLFVRKSRKHNRKLAAALSAKSDFLARMSHDMRTPLNAVLGFASLARDDCGDNESVRDSLAKISSSGEYLLGLINDVLDASKLESGKTELHPEIVEGKEFLGEIADEFKAQAKLRGITLKVDLDKANTPYVKLDRLRTRQIYSNLLNNALKFSEPGSVVEWFMEDTVIDEGHMKFVTTITDHGRGMSREFMKHMFEPFTQEVANGEIREGTGLGLMIVKRFVELSGGTIEAESEIGKGTRFTIRIARELPNRAEIEEYERKKRSDSDERPELSGKTVLLCEDHPLNREIASRLLKKKGVEVDCAENGKIGYEMFKAAPNKYDAVLMDIRMPVMGGVDSAKLIRGVSRDTPIIAVTANAYPEDIAASLDAGMNAHLSKPLDPDKLYLVLSEQITRAHRKAPPETPGADNQVLRAGK